MYKIPRDPPRPYEVSQPVAGTASLQREPLNQDNDIVIKSWQLPATLTVHPAWRNIWWDVGRSTF